ncbi:hypothetical protein Taro_050862 [Colocasia esculenta]|uniref:Uncharacterized protein n=1 Tax=Colocasia esculenta TaxID=4460 RepID=A0A843XF62_COLES|nr:hypothetical protein [Colocasia esculenta]
MDQQRRGNRGRGRQDDPGSLAAGAGQRSQGDTSRGSRRRRERRWRWANGGIWQQVAFRRTAVFVFQLLQIWLQNLAQFDQEEGAMIYHYDVNVRPEDLPLGSAAPEVSQNDLSTVKAELFRLYAAQFPDRVVAYDGERSLLSPGVLPERDFRVAVHGRVFHVSLKLLKQLVPSLRSGMRADAKVSCDVTPTHLWSEVQGRSYHFTV